MAIVLFPTTAAICPFRALDKKAFALNIDAKYRVGRVFKVVVAVESLLRPDIQVTDPAQKSSRQSCQTSLPSINCHV